MAHTDQAATSDATVGGSDLQTLTALNALYIDCVVGANAARFDRILADDFLCSNPDGSLVDKAAFLHQTRTAPKLASMDVIDLRIRIFGDVALIHGETRYLLADGRPGRGRYTDAWARRNGEWRAVSAHVTRIAV